MLINKYSASSSVVSSSPNRASFSSFVFPHGGAKTTIFQHFFVVPPVEKNVVHDVLEGLDSTAAETSKKSPRRVVLQIY